MARYCCSLIRVFNPESQVPSNVVVGVSSARWVCLNRRMNRKQKNSPRAVLICWDRGRLLQVFFPTRRIGEAFQVWVDDQNVFKQSCLSIVKRNQHTDHGTCFDSSMFFLNTLERARQYAL